LQKKKKKKAIIIYVLGKIYVSDTGRQAGRRVDGFWMNG
jgi:hypothetical protein